MLVTEGRKTNSLSESLLHWCQRIMRLGRDRSLDAMNAADVKRLADDVGVSPNELRALSRHGPNGAELLSKRMAELDLDLAEVSGQFPVTVHDLQRLCTLCGEKRRCKRDLNQDPTDPHWKDYCPNAEALGNFDAMPWKSRNEW